MNTKISHNSNFSHYSLGKNPCIVCGSEIKGAAKFLVEIDYMTGNVWAASQGECATSQGLFAVGSECAKRFAAGVLTEGVTA